jgi:hypothetical protein
MIPFCTKSTLLYELGKVKVIRLKRVAREVKCESAFVGREGT